MKKSSSKKEKPLLKYSDKSAGQPELIEIFNVIKKLLLPYEKGNLKIHGGDGGQINLISHKPVTIAGRERKEFWFASALIQKGYVGFYFTPLPGFHPELMNCLKGKSCFHIKNNSKELMSHIEAALKIGHENCIKLKWI